MIFPAVDLAERPGDILGIDPDRSPEVIPELRRLQPARHHHLVVGGQHRTGQVPVGKDAAGHRVQDGDVDTAVDEQVLCDQRRV